MTNIYELLLEEISLEGLDGITLQTLWIRIAEATDTELPIANLLQEDFWNAIRKISEFSFYELPEPRPDYIPYNRFLYIDTETDSTFYEPDNVPEDIYAHAPVNDVSKNIRGSCPTYSTRKDISEEVRNTKLSEAIKKWGNKLVIVASQKQREFALIGKETYAYIDLTPIQYCLLERIGRSRHHGEITLGKRSLKCLGEDAKSLFYIRKPLLKFKLITKQVFYQRSSTQNLSSSLLHLKRYYVETKSKQIMMTEQVVEYLKKKPNYCAPFSEVLNIGNVPQLMKKLIRTQEFQRVINIHVKVPYKKYFPESNPKLWVLKNFERERTIRLLQLIDPNIDVSQKWNAIDDTKRKPHGYDSEKGFLNYENLKLKRSYISQAAEIIRNKREYGCSQNEIASLMGVNQLYARSFCKQLVRRNIVTCVMDDIGRQRVVKFVSRKYEKDATLLIKQERDKILSFASSNPSKINEIKEPEFVDIMNLDETFDDNIEDWNHLENIEIEVNNVAEKNNEPPAKKIKLMDENKETTKNVSEFISQASTSTLEDTEKILNNDVAVNRNKLTVKVFHKKTILENKVPLKADTYELFGVKTTYRILKRANYIIEVVRELKVITDLFKLIKMIQENEADEGYFAKIDKKSLIRLLRKLSKEGHIKFFEANIILGKNIKVLHFICEPSINRNNSVIRSTIEQAKLKFKRQSLKTRTRLSVKPNTSKEQTNLEYDRKVAKLYGFCPKFMRMRIIHELLFYLVYENIDEPLTHSEDKSKWLESMNISPSQELINQMSPIYYTKEICWKTFIPPIPKHEEWSDGWICITDLILRLPIQLFLKCCSLMHAVEGLDYYYKDPVRKYFLIKHLPTELQNILFKKRKYIFQIHEICSRLCYCGLVQFGPHKLKEKDQVFIYINRKASILNTITSSEGYHEISPREYNKYAYYFEKLSDVEQYWYDLWSTCMNTNLGGRLCANGKIIILEQLETKPAMIEAIQPRTQEEAILRDNGETPGNHLGAAGLDSAFFAHLKRNWRWSFNNDIGYSGNVLNKKITATVKIQNPENPSEIIEVPVKKSTLSGSKTKTRISKKRQNSDNKTKAKKMKVSRKKRIIRKISSNKKPKIKRPFYDETDKIALKKMIDFRTKWSQLEDHILLLCTIALKFICPKRYKQIIPFSVIRDILHKLVPTSTSKTSRACQRRIIFIMKNPKTKTSVETCLGELHQTKTITSRFSNIRKEILSNETSKEQTNIVFVELVTCISGLFSKLIKPNRKLIHPKLLYKYVQKSQIDEDVNESNLARNKKPENVDEITLSVLSTVIHSSMCCSKDKISWAYQLFKIYERYPEHLLRTAVTKARNSQMISLKKSYVMRHKTKSGSVPLSSSPYQLSINYKYQLHLKLPFSIYNDMYSFLVDTASKIFMPENKNGVELEVSLTGTPIVLTELSNKIPVNYHFEIPEEIIVLDENVKNDKNYDNFLQKYNKFIEESKKNTSDKNSMDIIPCLDDLNLTEPGTSKKNYNSTSWRSMSSRFAFYLMRYAMLEDIDDSVSQHMHDYFIVKTCKTFITFPDISQQEEPFGPENFHSEFLKIRNEIGPNIIFEIKDTAMIPNKCMSEDELHQVLRDLNANETDFNFVAKLIQYVLNCDCYGATTADILALIPEPYKGVINIESLLDILVKAKIFLRTGINQICYIHFEHRTAWIIHSCKISRLNREKMIPVTSESKEKLRDVLHGRRSSFSLIELQKSKEQLDLRSQQIVNVLLSPWIRIDGSLNRRVLDRWIGTILMKCMLNQGISVQKLYDTFKFLRPVEISNIIKYLEKLKCITQYVFHISEELTLFSTDETTFYSEKATGLEDPEKILIDTYPDALTKYILFVGKKSYATDFIAML